MSIEYRVNEPLTFYSCAAPVFGDPGSNGESTIPLVLRAAGALRSRMLPDDRTDLGAFSRNEIVHPTWEHQKAWKFLELVAFTWRAE
jgi:hypothetical protein